VRRVFLEFSVKKYCYFTSTMAPIDPQKVVGNLVVAKAKYVLSSMDCQRRYVSLWKEKMLKGAVISVTMEAREGGTGRQTTFITALFNLVSSSTTKKVPLALVTYQQ
jgi:hypothetical protein